MELDELLLLVRTNTSEGTTEVIPEADFIRYMTTDADNFYPLASASTSSNRAHPGITGYQWFTEHLQELTENSNCRLPCNYLFDVCSNLDSWDFDEGTSYNDELAVHSFVYASALNPDLLTNFAVRGFGTTYPFARKQLWNMPQLTPQQRGVVESVEAEKVDKLDRRPIWLL